MKRDRPAKPGPIGDTKRSVYSRAHDPRPVKIVVSGGEIVGWLRRDGSFVKQGEPCCVNPLECERCFGPWPPRSRPWWRR